MYFLKIAFTLNKQTKLSDVKEPSGTKSVKYTDLRLDGRASDDAFS